MWRRRRDQRAQRAQLEAIRASTAAIVGLLEQIRDNTADEIWRADADGHLAAFRPRTLLQLTQDEDDDEE